MSDSGFVWARTLNKVVRRSDSVVAGVTSTKMVSVVQRVVESGSWLDEVARGGESSSP